MKKIVALCLTAALAFWVAACGGASSPAAPAAGGDTIKIGALAPLTGKVSVYGIATSNGIKMAVDEINAAGGVLGKQLELITLDEKGDPIEAVNAYNKLVDQGVAAILGDVTSTPCKAVAEVAVGDGMPMLTPTGTAADITQVGPNIFRTCFMDPFQGTMMATFAADELKSKSAAIIYDNGNDYSQGLAASFKAQAEAKGMQIAAYESYAEADVDFSTLLDKVLSKNPDALFVPDYYQKIALIAEQARSAGFQGAMLGGDGWDGVLDVLTADKVSVLNNCYFSNHYSKTDTDKVVVDFLANYNKLYGSEPNAFSALGYDSAYIMKAAIEKAGSTDKAAIVSALGGIQFTGVTGQITFDQNGDPIKSVAVTRFVDGKTELAAKISP